VQTEEASVIRFLGDPAESSPVFSDDSRRNDFTRN